MQTAYIEPTQAAAKALFSRGLEGPVVMLNLLRLRDIADYRLSPQLAPAAPISGYSAFQKYIDFSMPYLHASGGELLFLGEGGEYFIGPENERWDLVMLVKQSSLSSFLQFASNEEYLQGLGHRTAAIMDSRLLPIVQQGEA